MFVVYILLTLLFAVQINCDNCPPSYWYYEATNRCYKYDSNDYLNYTDAVQSCTDSYGYLVVISDATENGIINDICGNDYCWIGYDDIALEGTWIWIQNESHSFTNWEEGEPNSYLGTDEDCANMHPGGGWYDWGCSRASRYACEATAYNIIYTVAGTSIADYSGDGGPATSATMNYPQGVAVDSIGRH